MPSRALTRRLASLEGRFRPEEPQLVITISYVDNNRQVIGTQLINVGGPEEPYIPIEPARRRSIDDKASQQESGEA
jgi:hypothetical protein